MAGRREVKAYIGNGGEKLRDQIPVGSVDLNGVEAGLDGALSSPREGLADILDLLDRQGLGLRVAGRVGNCAGRPDIIGPSAVCGLCGVVDTQDQERVMVGKVAGLAAGVGELDYFGNPLVTLGRCRCRSAGS
jgi:hypothetical protein